MLANSQHHGYKQLRLNSTDSPAFLQKSGLQKIYIIELSDFFDSFTPGEFSNKLSVILQAYSDNDYYRESSPSDVLFVMEKLSDLVATAHCLYLNSFQDTPFTANTKCSDLEDIPAESSKVIASFFERHQLEEWQDTIKHITFFALCKDSPAEAGYQNDTLFMYNAFNRLVTACYYLFNRHKKR